MSEKNAEQHMGTERNVVLFHAGCSVKKSYFTGGNGAKWNEITTFSI
jgi:hypothetical protein